MTKQYKGVEDFVNQVKKGYAGDDRKDISFVILENDTPRYMGMETFAKYIDSTRNAVHHDVKKGRIPYFKQGKKIMIDRVKYETMTDILEEKYGVSIEEAIENIIKKGNSL